jgi:hypothetical protein
MIIPSQPFRESVQVSVIGFASVPKHCILPFTTTLAESAKSMYTPGSIVSVLSSGTVRSPVTIYGLPLAASVPWISLVVSVVCALIRKLVNTIRRVRMLFIIKSKYQK